MPFQFSWCTCHPSPSFDPGLICDSVCLKNPAAASDKQAVSPCTLNLESQALEPYHWEVWT